MFGTDAVREILERSGMREDLDVIFSIPDLVGYTDSRSFESPRHSGFLFWIDRE